VWPQGELGSWFSVEPAPQKVKFYMKSAAEPPFPLERCNVKQDHSLQPVQEACQEEVSLAEVGTKHMADHTGEEWVLRRHLKKESFLNYMFTY